MGPQRSNSYDQLLEVFQQYEPDHPLNTHMVISGPQVAEELSSLHGAAVDFGVTVSSMQDSTDHVLVTLYGPAARLALLAEAMIAATVGTVASAG